MDAAGAELIRAVNAINKVSDRKVGWDTLLQACRVISGKTIRILEIVYGAEIKRYFNNIVIYMQLTVL